MMGNERAFMAIERLKTTLRGETLKALDEYAAAVIKEAKAKHPYKDRTGALTRSITRGALGYHGNEARVELTAREHYAEYVEGGTRPHVIEARKAKVLHFVVDGKDVFTPKVRHPGSKPYPFLGPAILRTEDKYNRLMAKALDNAIRRAGG